MKISTFNPQINTYVDDSDVETFEKGFPLRSLANRQFVELVAIEKTSSNSSLWS